MQSNGAMKLVNLMLTLKNNSRDPTVNNAVENYVHHLEGNSQVTLFVRWSGFVH